MPAPALMSANTSSHDNEEDQENEDQALTQSASELNLSTPHPGATLLPEPIAGAVSTVTGLGSLGVKAGTKVGGWWLYAGREATLKTLSVTRSVVEQVLVLAGRDVAARSNGEIGQAEAANILEKSVSALYSTISTASFVASTGFYLTEATINSVSGLSLHGLSMLNAICGSTESSRAVAAIVTLLKNELNRPEAGEVVGYWDIVVAVIGFVLLQRWGRRKTLMDFRAADGEEPIWDTVVDDKGFRADVVGTRRKDTITLQSTSGNSVVFGTSPDEGDFVPLDQEAFLNSQQIDVDMENHTQLSEEEIRRQIVSQLPKGAKAVITSETITAKTIKVEIYDADTAHIEPPPGTVMVAERLNHNISNTAQPAPSQTIVFRTGLKRTSSTAEIDTSDGLRLTSGINGHFDDAENEDALVMRDTKRTAQKPDVPMPTSETNDVSSDSDDSISPRSKSPSPVANQKRSRKPPVKAASLQSASKIPVLTPDSKSKSKSKSSNKTEQPGVIKKAFQSMNPMNIATTPKENQSTLPRRRSGSSKQWTEQSLRPLSRPTREPAPKIIYPPPNLSRHQTPLTSPSSMTSPTQTTTSYFSMQDNRGDTMSKTETYSIHSVESRPGSPSFTRTQYHSVSGLTQTKSEIGLSTQGSDSRPGSSGSTLHHRRSRSFVPSLYSMGSKRSGEAVILAPKLPTRSKSVYEDQKIINVLTSEGKIPGIFPDRHMVKTVRRFARFSTASYGSNFLSVMGLANEERIKASKSNEVTALDVHHEHNSFSTHTGLPADSILLSSFYDPQGVYGNTEWTMSAISPLIHFISVDHDSKAVVLTCRGTLGFEDVLTDMTCDYDDMLWQGRKYKVHKGIHASARRLLGHTGSRVMATIKNTLDEYPDYGLVLCGHSLGGAVAALVAISISEQCHEESKTSFVTTNMPRLLTSTTDSSKTSAPQVQLPAGRPIHVYAYGTPATISEPLRLATRGLITTVVNHSDIVPCLSLGTLHDFRTIALHLKHDSSDAIEEVKARVWRRIRNAFAPSSFLDRSGPPPPENIAGDGVGEDTWAWSALKTLRATMINDKLVPPGEVFVVETTRIFDRLSADVRKEAVFGTEEDNDDRNEKLYRALGRPATRVQFKLIRDVETRFAELRFGRDMFSDHSPGRYEAALSALEKGICED